MFSRLAPILLSITVSIGLYALPGHSSGQDVPPAPALPQLAPVPPVPPMPPSEPVAEALPATPALPTPPAVPALPALPAVPAVPAMPAFPSIGMEGWQGDRHSFSMSGGSGDEPAGSCADLHIRFDGRDAVVKSEEHTITKAEAPTLRVRPHRNGGVQVQGWDQSNYSVTACKAAADNDGEAERILSQMTVLVQSGEVSMQGPNDADNDWTMYLLIRAPKAAAIDVETANGPLSFYSVDGKLTAHTTNGPISIRGFSGDAEIDAQNGPIHIAASSGNVRVHTQNGPISVDLKDKAWDGAGLSADATNGPVTLFVPSDYQSSFVVEARSYSPMSCRASICENARKTWDDTNRRIEFGNAPAVIHLSTVNGPVSVRSARDEE
jgi:hypothetical protein